MKLTTKYNLGQLVWVIGQRECWLAKGCPTCDPDADGNPSGQVVVRGTVYKCPACNGQKTERKGSYEWVVLRSGTIGQVDVVAAEPHDGNGRDMTIDSFQVSYMLHESGVGSGTNYPEAQLHATKTEALAECEQRQREGFRSRSDREWIPLTEMQGVAA